MAITTLAQADSGLLPPVNTVKTQGGTFIADHSGWLTLWYFGAYPPAATVNSSGLSGQALYTSPAKIPLSNPTSGNTYLARFSSRFSTATNEHGFCFYLVDRLWENSGIDTTITTPQTINSVSWPPRDINQSTNGDGVYIALEFSGGTGSKSVGASVITLGYTNSLGVSGRTGSVIRYPNTISEGEAVLLFALEAGDVGVRSVQSITFSSGWSSPGVTLVAYRPIIIASSFSGDVVLSSEEDIFNLAAPRIFDDSVLMYWKYITSSATLGYLDPINYQFTQG